MKNQFIKIQTAVLFIFFLLVIPPFVSGKIILIQEGLKFIDTDNPKKCVEEIYPWERDTCFIWNAAYHKEDKFCEFVYEKDTKIYCYHLLAVYSGNSELCKNTEVYEEYCNTEVEAINTNNPLLCENLATPSNCYDFVSLIYNDWELCYKSSNNVYQCLINIIQEKDDIGLCQKIKGEYDNSFCYAYFAIEREEPELCKKSDSPEDCYYPVAVSLKKPDLCINVPRDEKECKMTIARLTARDSGNVDDCENQDIEWQKGNCYEDLAVLKNSPELCKKSDGEESCLEMLESKRNASSLNVNIKEIDSKNSRNINFYITVSVVILFIIIISAILILKKKKLKKG